MCLIPRFLARGRVLRSLNQVIRALEATAEAEERGIFRTAVRSDGDSRGGERKKHIDGGDRGEDNKPCCEKHAFRLERSSLHMMEERVRDTLGKVCLAVWLGAVKRCCCSVGEPSAPLCFLGVGPCRRFANS